MAVGCYAQVAKEELEKMPEIDVVLGNEEKKDVVKYVENFMNGINKVIEIEDIATQKEFKDMGQITYTEKTRAVIKVQDGCNQFCSYCIIPYARGRVRSRNAESIIKEITQIAQNGIKEVVITGIHVASYGRDLGNENGLIELLEKIVAELENGKLSLDESVSKFEEGIKISKECNKTLEEAEKKITILINNDGETKEEEFKINE